MTWPRGSHDVKIWSLDSDLDIWVCGKSVGGGTTDCRKIPMKNFLTGLLHQAETSVRGRGFSCFVFGQRSCNSGITWIPDLDLNRPILNPSSPIWVNLTLYRHDLWVLRLLSSRRHNSTSLIRLSCCRAQTQLQRWTTRYESGTRSACTAKTDLDTSSAKAPGNVLRPLLAPHAIALVHMGFFATRFAFKIRTPEQLVTLVRSCQSLEKLLSLLFDSTANSGLFVKCNQVREKPQTIPDPHSESRSMFLDSLSVF